jgi:antitoxin VapB
MNAPSNIGRGRTATLFKSNRSQAVRIPKELAFPDSVKEVVIRKVGDSLFLCPEDQLWLSYFEEPGISDFPDRAPQGEYEVRESFDA